MSARRRSLVLLLFVLFVVSDRASHLKEPHLGLEFLLTVDATGIWGGTTKQQRERMVGRRGGEAL
jgi:hypothetical protein